jgi:hypothetical protein
LTSPTGGSGSGTGDSGRIVDMDLATGPLGGLGLLAWTVPGFAATVPGILLILFVLAQVLGGLAWLPVVRRRIGGFGFRRSS